FPPGEQRADRETEAFLRAASAWTPEGLESAAAARPGEERPAHPMDALTAGEIRAAKEILQASGRVDASAGFATLTLAESGKTDVLEWQPGQPFERRAFAVVRQDRRLFEAVVDLDNREVESWREVEGKQPRLLGFEFDVLPALRENREWREAMAARGYARDADVFCAPLSAGPAAGNRRRVLNVPCFDVEGDGTVLFARPIEGLMA